MSVAVIAYHRAMGRWEPDARGRLAKSAMALYAEQGFDQTTVAEIAARAGLTERTFFRHFADKREVLFYGMGSPFQGRLRALGERTRSAGPAGNPPRVHGRDDGACSRTGPPTARRAGRAAPGCRCRGLRDPDRSGPRWSWTRPRCRSCG